jgi:hypothetical protein
MGDDVEISGSGGFSRHRLARAAEHPPVGDMGDDAEISGSGGFSRHRLVNAAEHPCVKVRGKDCLEPCGVAYLLGARGSVLSERDGSGADR